LTATLSKGRTHWEKELHKIEAEMLNKEDPVNFYTAMYHASLMPTVYMDSNGEYKGLDQEVHRAEGLRITPHFHCGIPLGPFIRC
jgi:putative alpha-1,2-mannosidase